jgi:hypothetical protein
MGKGNIFSGELRLLRAQNLLEEISPEKSHFVWPTFAGLGGFF